MFDIDALKKIPKSCEPELVERLWQQAVTESKWAVWPAFKHVRDEHAEIALRSVDRLGDSQVHLLRAGHTHSGASGLRAAGEFFAYASRSTNLPALMKRLAKDRLKFAGLLPITRSAIEVSVSGPAPDIITFWGLVYLVAAADPTDSVLAKVSDANARWGDKHATFERVMKAAAGS
jgi:hypothetical protein